MTHPDNVTETTSNGAGTSYLILEKDPALSDSWAIVGRCHAASAAQAIRNTVPDDYAGGTLVAVPERSWRPAEVSVKKTVTLG